MHDFMALEVLNGNVKFSYSLGGEINDVVVNIPGGVSDGNWHTLTVDYVNMVGIFYNDHFTCTYTTIVLRI